MKVEERVGKEGEEGERPFFLDLRNGSSIVKWAKVYASGFDDEIERAPISPPYVLSIYYH